MKQVYSISDLDCNTLAIKIRNDFFRPINTFKTTIFLCGANITTETTIRSQLDKELKSGISSVFYDLIYPEDIFDDLLYSTKSKDLLTLERLLADSVDAIIIVPESPGSYAELGAFSHDKILRTKIICVIDSKYKKAKSFISQGPLKLIKKANKDGIIYVDYNNISSEANKLHSVLKKIKKYSGKINDKVSLLQLDNYLLLTIYLLEPVQKYTLDSIVSHATADKPNSFQATTVALTMLTKKQQIELTTDGYKLTEFGYDSFINLRKYSKRVKNQEEIIKIDNLRLDILNLTNRGKKLKG